jgi:hypothetical protein
LVFRSKIQEAIMKEGGRKTPRGLAVAVRFEANRLAAAHLADAYEQVLPTKRRAVRAAGRPGGFGEAPTSQRAGGMRA